jgi:hypothetical protein
VAPEKHGYWYGSIASVTAMKLTAKALTLTIAPSLLLKRIR